MTDTPNVVLICADQWRGDCLSAAGHPVLRTPYLDAIADVGTRFSRAYSAVPTCVPARAALHTGLSQDTHGRVSYEDGVPWSYDTTLAGEFARHGYQTHAVGKLHVYPERHRLGFDDVDLHDGYLEQSRRRERDYRSFDDYLPWLAEQAGESTVADYADNGLDCNSIIARPWDRAERLHPTNWATTRAVDFLYRRDPTVPFFLFLSYHRPHPPLDPPAWAFEQYLAASQYEPPVGDWADVFAPYRVAGRHDAVVADLDPVTLQRARAGYYGNMAHLDLQINRFLTALFEFGLGEDTVLCFVSDHGEMLGEHHLFQKGFPYEGSTRVPLLLAGPGVAGGVVDDRVAELRDVLPTLLGAAGVPVPGTVEGRDLLGTRDAGWREYLHGEHERLGQSMQWITDARWKYVWMSGTGHEQLFDLSADPGELHDLAADPARGAAGTEALTRCREHLVHELRDRPEGYVDPTTGTLTTGRPPRTRLPTL